MLSGRHNVTTVPETHTHIKLQTSTLFCWARVSYGEAASVTWEILAGSGDSCVHTASQPVKKAGCLASLLL